MLFLSTFNVFYTNSTFFKHNTYDCVNDYYKSTESFKPVVSCWVELSGSPCVYYVHSYVYSLPSYKTTWVLYITSTFTRWKRQLTRLKSMFVGWYEIPIITRQRKTHINLLTKYPQVYTRFTFIYIYVHTRTHICTVYTE